MRQTFRNLILISVFFFSFQSVIHARNGQVIKVLSFDEFEPMLYLETDSVYVVNFWATWCAPCVREIPAFEKLNEVYESKKVKVLLVSLDFPNQLESRVIPFVSDMNVQSEVILLDERNPNRWIPLVSEEWTGAIPATVIYSKDFRGFYQREFHFEELEALIQQLIN
ncbi:MAG: TlpA family protein disulfide reductase [Bacteroidales bacterium]|nr:TlpA family protein disulfide reductase [Bacteroidales bacterium]